MLAEYDAVAAGTEAVIRGIADLGQAVPVPRGVPWFPDDVEAWSVLWVLLRLIDGDRAACRPRRHRAGVDRGATCYELVAALEGWPTTDWLHPRQPRETAAA